MISMCIPTGGRGISINFMVSVINLLFDVPCNLLIKQSSNLANNRERLVMDSLQNGASHILFMDDDMIFPPEAVKSLIKADKPIVITNYRIKMPEVVWTAKVEPSSGLEEVEYGGLGLALINAEVFKALPQPWFAFAYNHEYKEHTSEDAYFFKKAKQYGFPCLVDHDASKLISHEGMYAYN